MTGCSAADISIGIIANPASGRDIRRLVSAASGFTVAEKVNIVRRLCLGMRYMGVSRICLMPDLSGIVGSLLKQKEQGSRVLGEHWPDLVLLDMPVEESAVDTQRAVEHMVQSGVRVIIVLGGDGTHRLVAKHCGSIPLVALSTGTNNAFPHYQEATVAGMAAGLVGTGAVPICEVTERNKVLRVGINDARRDLALVDLCLTDDRWIGSRAMWQPEKVREIFVTYAQADAIGLSAVAGLANPVSRDSGHGLHLRLCPPGQGRMTLCAPIAPGLIVPMGIADLQIIRPHQPCSLTTVQGAISLDGEREYVFHTGDSLRIWLDLDGPLTINVSRTMHLAAERGMFSMSSPTLAVESSLACGMCSVEPEY